MSTTFGIRIPETNEIVEVAFRTHYIRWTNPLAHLLPNEIEVIPIDNSAQGIHNIGDIKQSIRYSSLASKETPVDNSTDKTVEVKEINREKPIEIKGTNGEILFLYQSEMDALKKFLEGITFY